MARLDGFSERIHQPVYDTLVGGIGKSSVGNSTALFGSANIGDISKTNLDQAGQLSSDQTFIIKTLRCSMYFQGLADSEFGIFGTLPDLAAGAQGSNSRAADLYNLIAYGAHFRLSVGTKPMFTAPLWYVPAGGGPNGYTTNNSRNVITNGEASDAAVFALGKSIHVPARQNFKVTIEFFPFVRLGAGQTAAYVADLSPLDNLNQFDGVKLVQFFLDGIQTRDVQ